MGFVKPVHAQKWQGQRMVLGAYLEARHSTGGSTGVREVIKGHNFRVGDQSPWYDVNVLFPLAGACVDSRSGEQARLASLVALNLLVASLYPLLMTLVTILSHVCSYRACACEAAWGFLASFGSVDTYSWWKCNWRHWNGDTYPEKKSRTIAVEQVQILTARWVFPKDCGSLSCPLPVGRSFHGS